MWTPSRKLEDDHISGGIQSVSPRKADPQTLIGAEIDNRYSTGCLVKGKKTPLVCYSAVFHIYGCHKETRHARQSQLKNCGLKMNLK